MCLPAVPVCIHHNKGGLVYLVLVAQFLQKQLAHTLHQQVSCLGGAVEQPVARVELVMGTLRPAMVTLTHSAMHSRVLQSFSPVLQSEHQCTFIQKRRIMVPSPRKAIQALLHFKNLHIGI